MSPTIDQREHQSEVGSLEPSVDGWFTARCTCGYTFGPAPDLEVVVDVLMDHAFLMGQGVVPKS